MFYDWLHSVCSVRFVVDIDVFVPTEYFRIGERKFYDESVLGAGTVFDPNPSTVQADMFCNEGKTKTRAVGGAALACRLTAIETLEHLFALGWRYAGTVICHDDPDCAIGRLDGQPGCATCVLGCVFNEIRDHPLDSPFVHVEPYSGDTWSKIDRYATCSGRGGCAAHELSDLYLIEQ
jgi:hypothetical protein